MPTMGNWLAGVGSEWLVPLHLPLGVGLKLAASVGMAKGDIQ